jgi:ABC-2 type transport system ATP-binding protein
VEHLATEGMAVLYTTHYMEEAERLCDRIAIVDEGRIVAEGTRPELVATIGSQDVVRLEVAGDVARAMAALESLEQVTSVDADGTTLVCLLPGAARRCRCCSPRWPGRRRRSPPSRSGCPTSRTSSCTTPAKL